MLLWATVAIASSALRPPRNDEQASGLVVMMRPVVVMRMRLGMGMRVSMSVVAMSVAAMVV